VKRWLFILLSSMLILGAACGDDGGSTDAGGDDQETESEDTPSEEPSEEPTEEAEGGGLAVTGVDFAFQVDPATLTAGETEITFTNDGEEQHQMIMARLAEGAPSLDKLIELPQKESEKFLEEEFNQAAKPIKPGEETTFKTDLAAGTYGMVCFVSNKEGPHAFQGMFNTFTVE
jgi:plastocyanin